jgi:hypothetical protein
MRIMLESEVRQRLVDLAATHQVSLSAMSRVIGRSRAYVPDYVSGRIGSLSDDDRRLIADFLGVSHRDLGVRGEDAAA